MIIHAAVVGRRTCAVLAAGSAALHGISLGHAASRAAAVLTVAMVVACLYCARDLWNQGTLQVWVLVASMNLVMIAIHVPAAPVHHHGGGVTAVAPAHYSTAMALAIALAAVEVVVATAVAFHKARRDGYLRDSRPV